MTDSQLRGIDFSSSPSRRKPCVLAVGRLLDGGAVQLDDLRTLPSLDAYAASLHEPGPWVGAFDLPFGLPRELVETLGWPTEWRGLVAHYMSLSRHQIREAFAGFCAARPVGGKFAHRRCDGPAGSSPSMKWVNPPVAFMMHAGVPPIIEAGCDVPGLLAGDASRVALEAYPGLVARDLLGRRSYKSDTPAKQTADRAQARAELVDALLEGRGRLGLRLVLNAKQRQSLIEDPMADALDAVLCLLLAGFAATRPHWGRSADADPLEGWIVGA